MKRPCKYILLLCVGALTLLTSCVGEEGEEDAWYRPVDEFVSSHQSLMPVSYTHLRAHET